MTSAPMVTADSSFCPSPIPVRDTCGPSGRRCRRQRRRRGSGSPTHRDGERHGQGPAAVGDWRAQLDDVLAAQEVTYLCVELREPLRRRRLQGPRSGRLRKRRQVVAVNIAPQPYGVYGHADIPRLGDGIIAGDRALAAIVNPIAEKDDDLSRQGGCSRLEGRLAGRLIEGGVPFGLETVKGERHRLLIAREVLHQGDAVTKGKDGDRILRRQAAHELVGGRPRLRQGVTIHAAAHVHDEDDGEANISVYSSLEIGDLGLFVAHCRAEAVEAQARHRASC